MIFKIKYPLEIFWARGAKWRIYDKETLSRNGHNDTDIS